MATIDELNALNIRPRSLVRIDIYDNTNQKILEITEDNLIRAVVSLRSDLSRINPTLPESDIEIDAYFDTDISEQLAAAGEELQVRYRWWPDGASYGNPRYFYTDQRITWSEKILHIHAVDQVHLLDEELPPIYIGQDWNISNLGYDSISNSRVLYNLALAFRDFIRGSKDNNTGNLKVFSNDRIANNNFAGVIYLDGAFSTVPDGGALNILQPRMTRRQAIAKMMNYCRWDFNSGALQQTDNFWLTYVDAGWPTTRYKRNTDTPRQIKKEDCGNFKVSKEPIFSSITATVNDVIWQGAKTDEKLSDPDVSGTIMKQKGITVQYGGYTDGVDLGTIWKTNGTFQEFYLIPNETKPGTLRLRPPVQKFNRVNLAERMRDNYYGKWLLDENIDTNNWTPDPNVFTYIDLSGSKWTDPYDPDIGPDSPSTIWNDWIYYGVIDPDALSVDVANESSFFVTANERTMTKTRPGRVGDGIVLQDDVFLSGHAIFQRFDNSGSITALPDLALDRILDTSNIVGSFTWKGDPRLQPRDYVQLELDGGPLMNEHSIYLQDENGDDILDESNESDWKKIITIENITLTHEGGGTISEITYREGYC